MTDDVEATQLGPVEAGPTELPAAAPTAEPTVTAPAAPPTTAAPAASRANGGAGAGGGAGSRGGGPRGIARSIAVGLFFVLTCLSLVLATTTWWLHDTVLDTDHFVAVTGPLVESEAVQGALVQATTTQVDEALDLGPIGRYVVAGIAREVYSSDAFATIWERAMRVVHTQLVAVLRDDSSIAQVEDGKVVVNLFPVIDAVLQKINSLDLVIAGRDIQVPTLTNPEDPAASRAEISAALGRELKPTFGVIPVADSAKLETVQRLVTIFDAFVVVLFVVFVVLALVTIALARRRVRMVALLGVGCLAALLAARLIIDAAADGLATAVVDAGPGAIIGSNVVAEIASSYREFARIVLMLALVAAVVAALAEWLVGRSARAAGADGRTGAVGGWFLAFAGLALALATLLVIGLTVATFAIVAVVYIAWILVILWASRRSRSPDGGPAPSPA
jgi:hypothetical protein